MERMLNRCVAAAAVKGIAILVTLSVAVLQPATAECPMAGHARGPGSSEEAAAYGHGDHGADQADASLAGTASTPLGHDLPDHSDLDCGLVMACGSLVLAAQGESPSGGQTETIEVPALPVTARYTTVFPTHDPPPPRLPV